MFKIAVKNLPFALIVFLLISFLISPAYSQRECSTYPEDPCNLSNPFIAPADLAMVRNSVSNPSIFSKLFFEGSSNTVVGGRQLSYKEKLKNKLTASPGGASFSMINDYGLAAIFSSIVAYELKPALGGIKTVPGIENGNNVLYWKTVLDPRNAGEGTACQTYVSLTVQFFYFIYPSPPKDISIIIIGLGRESRVDGHVTLSMTGSGIPLILDPTSNQYSVNSIYDLFLGKRSTSVVQISKRSYGRAKTRDYLDNFNQTFKEMLLNGDFDYRSIYYVFKADPNHYYNLANDYLMQVQPVQLYSEPEFFLLSDRGMDVKSLRANGIVDVSNSLNKRVSITEKKAFLLNRENVWEISSSGWKQVAAGVRQIASDNRKKLYILYNTGATKLYQNSQLYDVNYGGTKDLIGGNGIVNLLTTSGRLWQITDNGWTLKKGLNGEIILLDSIYLGYPEKINLKNASGYRNDCTGFSDPLCQAEIIGRTEVGAESGDFVWLKGDGKLLLQQPHIKTILPAYHIGAFNMLTSEGTAWRWDVDARSCNIVNNLVWSNFEVPQSIVNRVCNKSVNSNEKGFFRPVVPVDITKIDLPQQEVSDPKIAAMEYLGGWGKLYIDLYLIPDGKNRIGTISGLF